MFAQASEWIRSTLSLGPSTAPAATATPDTSKKNELPALSLSAFDSAAFAPLAPLAPAQERPPVVRRDVPLRGPTAGKLAFVLDNVFSAEECANFIAATEQLGYAAALVNVGYTQLHLPDVRNNTRCMVDSTVQAGLVWDRLREYVPSQFRHGRALGLNERLRFLRYDPDQQFQPHYDGVYRRQTGEESKMTVIAYLNEGFEGGATRFFVDDDESGHTVDIVPKTGSVLIFQHNILHEGSLLVQGRKYIMRTDVMFDVR